MKKSFKELAQQIESIQEDQQGKLQGGFASLSMGYNESLAAADNNCTNNCTCTNTVSGCGGQVNSNPSVCGGQF